MPKFTVSRSAGEPELGSAIDTLQIPAVGHHPFKREVVMRKFPFDGFGLVLSGKGYYQVDEGPVHPLESPAVFYVWEGPRFRYGPIPGTTWDERYLCFTGERVADWQRWHWLPHIAAPRSLLDIARHVDRHRRVMQAFQEGKQGAIDKAKLETELLVYELHREAVSGESRNDPLSRLLEEWQEHPPLDKDLNLPRCAARLEMSYSGFREKFRERTGLSVYQYLLRLRLGVACRLLIESDQQIKAIANASGFASVESFCRAFRRLKRMTTTEYRTKHRWDAWGATSR